MTTFNSKLQLHPAKTHRLRGAQGVDFGLDVEQQLDVGISQDGIGGIASIARPGADDQLLNAVERPKCSLRRATQGMG